MEVVIADDHPIFRSGLVNIIQKNERYTLVGEASNGTEAWKMIKEFEPGIAILDIEMPEMTGLDVLEHIRKFNLDVSVIIMTMYKDEAVYDQVKKLGAACFLLKDNTSDLLINAMDAIRNGQKFDDSFQEDLLIKNDYDEDLKLLSSKEIDVLRLIARDKTTSEIADMLFISKKTVENHRSNICKKLSISGPNAIYKYLSSNNITLE